MPTLQLTPDEIESIFASDDAELQEMVYLATTHPYYTFEPREDDPNDHDEQASFVRRNYVFDPAANDGRGCYLYGRDSGLHNASDDRFRVCLGGTGSGKTAAAGLKTAEHVLETPPPRPYCPFWVIGETFDQVCQAAWVEKLSQFIPSSEILGYVWYRSNRRWPYAVMLRHPERRSEVGWVVEFKSYKQGLGGMKAVSIGGYWFNEEVPYSLVAEVQGRCRDYDSPGWADFTPIECRDPEWPDAYDNLPEGWRFFHLNSLRNDALPDGFMERYLSTVPEDLRELRTIGRFTTLRGAVFKEFRKSIHVIDWTKFEKMTGRKRIPEGWRRIRGLDFGFNNPFCCLWIARDEDDRYYVYDEHYEAQRLIEYHASRIKGKHPWPNEPWYGPAYSDHDPQVRAELAKLGIPTTLANKSEAQGIEMLRSLMMVKGDGRSQFYVFDNCVNLIREILGARYPEGTDKKNPQDVPLDKDNHALDACRYAIYTDRVGTRRIDVTAMKVRPESARRGVLLAGANGNGRR